MSSSKDLPSRRIFVTLVWRGRAMMMAALIACCPIGAQCYLPAPVPLDPMAGDLFGTSVALSGDHCAVGVPNRDGANPADPSCNSGTAYVFERVGDTWVQQALVPPPNPACQDSFGHDVAIDGDTLAISAQTMNSFAGAVFVYERQGSTWSQVATLSAADANYFGYRLALNGDRLVATSFQLNATFFPGAAYVYERVAGAWVFTQKLIPSDPAVGNAFGAEVALDSDAIVVGAPGVDMFPGFPGCDSGAAYVFEWTAGVWSETQKLTASDAHCTAMFGVGVDIHGDLIAVGASRADVGCPPTFPECNNGAVYVFEKGVTWQEQQQLLADPPDYAAFFGLSLAFDGADKLVVGNSVFSSVNSGVVVNYLRQPGGMWVQESMYAPPNNQPGDNFGRDIAACDGRVLVSAFQANVVGPGSGKVYYYANTSPMVGCDGSFIRGDCNDDGMKNIADAIFGLSYLFAGGVTTTLACEDACDANDDGTVNIADAIAQLGELFGSPSIPLPPPASCATDPTPDGLTCLGSLCP